MIIKVEHLNKSIGKNEILRNVSFQITDNGVVGLLGPNGAGKSTLMKILTGLWTTSQNPSAEAMTLQLTFGEGETYEAKPGNSLPHEVSKHIGYLPENNPLYEDMYVREYLMFMAELSGIKSNEREDKIQELIQTVGLTEMAHKKIRELSKGYRQRVGLAQAIIADPQLLILDEPTTGLDPNQLDEIRALIKELGKNRIVILSTHILQEVEAMCDRVIILAKGEIREDTTNLNNLEELFRKNTKEV